MPPPPDDPPPDDPAEGTRSAATIRRRDTALAGHARDEATARSGLDDPAPPVRATALGALARMERLDAGDVAKALRDPAPEVRARAAELAVGLAGPAVPILQETLRDPDVRVVEAGCFALGEIGSAATGSVTALAAVGRDHDDPLCREAAVAALGAIGDPEGLPAILHATSDKPAVRRRAVLALAPFSGPEVDQALERALTDRDWQVRQAAEDLGGGRA